MPNATEWSTALFQARHHRLSRPVPTVDASLAGGGGLTMLVRREPGGIRLFSQPAHAWVSGQMARRWGAPPLGAFHPRDEICLAAEIHDIGFLAWEQNPTLDPQTGLPHDFMEMPDPLHYGLWENGIRDVLSINRYAALLVSLHFTHLTLVHGDPGPAGDPGPRETFLRNQRRLQAALTASLRADPALAAWSEPEPLERNRTLVGIWDWLSLRLLLGLEHPEEIKGVPGSEGTVTLELEPIPGREPAVRLRPWPFQCPAWQLTCDSKRVDRRFVDVTSMRAALGETPFEAFTLQLVPWE